MAARAGAAPPAAPAGQAARVAPQRPIQRPLQLAVDASDAPRGVFHCRLQVPAAPGPLALAYPKWVQGEHGPTGPIMQVAGLAVSAAGRPVSWRRDPLDMALVRVEVPAAADSLEVVFDYLSPPEGFGAGYGETPNATAHLLIADWHDLVMWPLGRSAAEIPVAASLRLPAGWQLDTALAVVRREGETITFAPTSLYTLIDSPVLAGEIFRTIELGAEPGTAGRERISLAADRRAALAVPEDRLAAYRRLPLEAEALFGARHYRQYRWLLALGDSLDQNGLEHHESSDDRGRTTMFEEPSMLLQWGSLLPHEYVHSWNGKYRRPSGLATGDPDEPLRTDLLWVYEGLTRYLGDFLLTTRSGIRTAEQSRDYAAWVAANQDHNRPGRSWRPLADTAASVQLLGGLPQPWTAYRRTLDYYDESLLIWLEADTILRRLSGGARSLDDFCRLFFGGAGTGTTPPPASPAPMVAPGVAPYSREDVYAALGRIAPYDWRAFFESRVDAVAPRAPLGGLEAAGWKLVYDGRPNDYQLARAKNQKLTDLSFSLGIWLKEDGTVADIVVGSPAWQAGLGPGMKLIAVGTRPWSAATLAEEIRSAAHSPEAIAITVEQGDAVRTVKIDYHGGEIYPHLERDPGRPDLLAAILASRVPAAPRAPAP